MAVERDITWNIRHFQGALRCDRNFDVVYRVFRICGREACMFFVDGFAKDEIMEKLLEFFYGIQDEDLLRDAHTFSKSCVPYCEVAISGEEDTIVGQILSGVWAVFVDGMGPVRADRPAHLSPADHLGAGPGQVLSGEPGRLCGDYGLQRGADPPPHPLAPAVRGAPGGGGDLQDRRGGVLF